MAQFLVAMIVVTCLAILVAWLFKKSGYAGCAVIFGSIIMACGLLSGIVAAVISTVK